MFNKLDRYLLRQFITVFMICFMSLNGLYIVIDAFGHLDSFVAHASGGGNIFAILGEYYGYRTIAFFDKTSGILGLIAAMFTITWIQRHNEMTALMAAGVSRIRIIRPVIFSVVAIALLTAAGREVVIPKIRHRFSQDTKNLARDTQVDIEWRYDRKTNLLLGGTKGIIARKEILQPTVSLPHEISQYGKQISATLATHHFATSQHPAGYLLQGVEPAHALLKQKTLSLENAPVVITPVDAAWLQPEELFVVTDISYELLAGGASWRDYASTSELIQELKHPSTDIGNDVRVKVHSRFLQPFLDLTLLMLGLPLVVSKGNKSPFIAVGFCLGIVSVFLAVQLGCVALGGSGWISPALAAWIPLILFVPVATRLSTPLWD